MHTRDKERFHEMFEKSFFLQNISLKATECRRRRFFADFLGNKRFSTSGSDFKKIIFLCFLFQFMTQGKIDLRNESGRPMKVKVVREVSEKRN